jgi:hypothetical protein
MKPGRAEDHWAWVSHAESKMEASQLRAAVKAAKACASALGLRAEEAVLLSNSNRIALRLLPCDVLARVAPTAHPAGVATLEIEVARQLAGTGSPVAAPDPRVQPRAYKRDGFVVTFWRYYEPMLPQDAEPAEYAQALERLHRGMREIEVPAPHCTDRVAEALRIVDDRARSPELGDTDRELLSSTLRKLSAAITGRGAPEQPLHGEPHPGNVLRTEDGLLFTDLETCCRGPVEWDIAHYARIGADSWSMDPAVRDLVGQLSPGADRDLIRTCWLMYIAIVTTWRWDRNDQFPDGLQMREEWTAHLRAALERDGANAAG